MHAYVYMCVCMYVSVCVYVREWMLFGWLFYKTKAMKGNYKRLYTKKNKENLELAMHYLTCNELYVLEQTI